MYESINLWIYVYVGTPLKKFYSYVLAGNRMVPVYYSTSGYLDIIHTCVVGLLSVLLSFTLPLFFTPSPCYPTPSPHLSVMQYAWEQVISMDIRLASVPPSPNQVKTK
jgi:hypothetical protein